MARSNFQVTFGQALGDGQYKLQAGAGGAASGTIDTTAVDAAIAAALAAAGPIHDSTPEIEAIEDEVALLSVTATNSGDLVLSFDTTAVTSLNQLRRAFDALLQTAAASGMV